MTDPIALLKKHRAQQRGKATNTTAQRTKATQRTLSGQVVGHDANTGELLVELSSGATIRTTAINTALMQPGQIVTVRAAQGGGAMSDGRHA